MKTMTILPEHYKTYMRFVSSFMFRNPKYVTASWILGAHKLYHHPASKKQFQMVASCMLNNRMGLEGVKTKLLHSSV